MALADRILTLKLVTDVGDISKGMKTATTGMERVDKEGQKTENRFKRIGASLKSMGGAIASWGKAMAGALIIGGIEKVVGALGDAYDGFRSGEKAAARLAKTFKNLGLSGKQADRVLARIGKDTKALGISDDEANDAFGVLIKTVKGDVPEAFKRLQIAYDLVANGSAPNLTSAIKVIDAAAKGSSKVVDKWGLDSKTAGGRITELGKSVKGAAKNAAALDPMGTLFNAISEDLEGIVGSFVAADFSGMVAAFGDLGNDIADALFGPVGSNDKRDSATKGLVNKFGAWGATFAASIATGITSTDWGTTLSDTFDTALGAVVAAVPNMPNLLILAGALATAIWVASLIASAFGAVLGAPGMLASALIGGLKLGGQVAIGIMAGTVAGLLSSGGIAALAAAGVGLAVAAAVIAGFVLILGPDKFLEMLMTPLTMVQEQLQSVGDGIGQALAGDIIGGFVTVMAGLAFAAIFAIASPFIAAFAIVNEAIKTVFGVDILATLQGLFDEFLRVGGELAGELVKGIVDGMAGLAGDLAGIVKDAVNGLIDLLNDFQFTIPTLEVPIPSFRLFEGTIADTGPLGGGSFKVLDGFNIDPFNIPHLAEGGIVNRPTVALLGEAGREAVVPLDRLGGSINVNITMGVGDPVAVGREVDRVLKAYRKRAGLAYA